jgi:O-antigen chain-terminating methyltransferase
LEKSKIQNGEKNQPVAKLTAPEPPLLQYLGAPRTGRPIRDFLVRAFLRLIKIAARPLLQSQDSVNTIILQRLQEQNHELTALRSENSRLIHAISSLTPSSHIAPPKTAAEATEMTRPFYLNFTDQFRGPRDLIISRLHSYRPFLRKLPISYKLAPALDIGCGRGEWLEYLKLENFSGLGIDMDAAMVNQCRDLGFAAEVDDGLSYLKRMPNDYFSVVSAFHVAEHMKIQDLEELLKETHRSLKSGGIAIFETPNPENLRVSSFTFYMDPTHLKPLPPDLFKFLAHGQGFEHVEILRLQPREDSRLELIQDPAVRELISELAFGPQDYALLCFKSTNDSTGAL